MRIAMWSGPRNLSTAMMYAFAARGDCAVMDEPFYACYLKISGAEHPLRSEILAAQPTDPADVIAQICGPVPAQKPHFYQKHMVHHMIEGIDREWMRTMHNVFLIRHPARVVASYARKRQQPAADDLGFRQQAELFAQCRVWGDTPLVVDSADIRADPARVLRALCEALELPWREEMLRWKPGGRPEDGVWASHWYDAVHRSSGFAGPEGPLPELEGSYADLARQAMDYYAELSDFRLH